MFRASYVLWLLALLTSCANLRPEDAAPASPFRVDAQVEARFPGARAILEGVDLSGERSLRDGDRVLLGVEVVVGESTKRHLLELIVHRGEIGKSEGVMTFTPGEQSGVTKIPQRATRMLDLELVLRTPDGAEVERSRLHDVLEFTLDESFVDGIQRSQAGDKRSGLVAELRLVQIAQMLNGDPILQSLLREAASVPWDLSLLWRRKLHLVADLENARKVTEGDLSRQPYELPFDMFLNDSLLVRLVATVTAPHGPSGAMGGIVGLRAQDARNPEQHMSLHVLGAARGPASEWQQHGVHAAYGYNDEGQGLAFSPNGRFLAMPGTGTQIEVRDLTAADPTVARSAVCANAAADMAFLDEQTLVVVSEHHVTLFDVASGSGGLRELAVHEVSDATLCALEVGDACTVFVGSGGAGVECWQFAADRTQPPQRELVQAPRSKPMEITIDGGDGAPERATVMATEVLGIGWLLAVDANRFLARSDDDEIEWRRTTEGAWHKQAINRVDRLMSRGQRISDAPTSRLFERLTKGMSLVRCDAPSMHAFGGGPLSLTNDRGTRMLNRCNGFRSYCHGFSPDGRFYAYVSPGFRALVDTDRFLE